MDRYYRLPELINENCDVFYHIAWSVTEGKRNEDILGQSKNIQYTLNALDIARKLGCKKFVGAGSQAEYGPLNIEKINENSMEKPIQHMVLQSMRLENQEWKKSKELEQIFGGYGYSTFMASIINQQR